MFVNRYKNMKTIKMKTIQYTKKKDLIRINNELGEKADKGLLVGIRQESHLLQLAEPRINGIWNIYLNDDGNITKIVLW